jgi:hypothetical protein
MTHDRGAKSWRMAGYVVAARYRFHCLGGHPRSVARTSLASRSLIKKTPNTLAWWVSQVHPAAISAAWRWRDSAGRLAMHRQCRGEHCRGPEGTAAKLGGVHWIEPFQPEGRNVAAFEKFDLPQKAQYPSRWVVTIIDTTASAGVAELQLPVRQWSA